MKSNDSLANTSLYGSLIETLKLRLHLYISFFQGTITPQFEIVASAKVGSFATDSGVSQVNILTIAKLLEGTPSKCCKRQRQNCCQYGHNTPVHNKFATEIMLGISIVTSQLVRQLTG